MAPMGMTSFVPEQSRRDNDKTLVITKISLLLTKMLRSHRSSLSNGHRRDATQHNSQRDTRTSHRPTRRYWNESHSGDNWDPYRRMASSVEVREVFGSLDGVNAATRGRALSEMCSCDEIMCRRGREKILEYANNPELRESSWDRYIRTMEKSPSENKSNFAKISKWVDREVEVRRSMSTSKENVERATADLAWLRANHPFTKER